VPAAERAYPELELPARAIVVVPHPDDETLALGGTLQQLQAAGSATTLVLVTDGEASHPADDPDRTRSRRAAELTAALTELAVSPVIDHLRLPDAAVDRHEDALIERLTALTTTDPGAAILAPHPEDVHRDHRACGRAADTVAREQQRRILHYAVWLWDRGDIGSWHWPWTVACYLTPDQLERKTGAVRCFGSQLQGIVPAEVVLRHSRDFELLEEPPR
jgi:LmbE family N-acetylglucosaminyl deacetylase